MKTIKKPAFYLILACLIINVYELYAQEHPDFWIDVTAGHGVREVNDVTAYFFETGKLDSAGKPEYGVNYTNREIYTYDGEGNLTSEANYHPMDDLDLHWTASYEGGLMREKIQYSSDSIPISKIVFTYNRKEQLIHRETFIDKEGLSKSTQPDKLDVAGIMKSISLMKQRSAYDSLVYDNNGDLVEEYAFKNGMIWRVMRWEYVYDQKKNLLEKSYFVGNTQLKKWLYNYNKGQEISRTYYGRGRLEWSRKYEYDNKGRIVKELQYRNDGGLQYIITFKYDDMGNLEERSVYNPSQEQTMTYTYLLDQKGNWEARILKNGDKPVSMRMRVLVY